MKTRTLQELGTLQNLVREAQLSDGPIVVFDSEDECLIAMRPPVFERILFDTDLIRCAKPANLHL